MDLIDFLQAFAASFAGALAVQCVAFLCAVRLKRVDLIDVAWGLSFIVSYLAVQLTAPSSAASSLIVGFLVTLWGLRLALHIFRRFLRSNAQDKRYTNLISQWPEHRRTTQTFLRLFLVQAVLVAVISLPVTSIVLYGPAIHSLSLIGVFIWLIGYACEVVADRQLSGFIKQQKRNGVMQTGIWRYSRHPNYFGELLMWWGIAIFSFSTPQWWLGVIGATTITILICFVSGIPLAEKQAMARSGWQSYKRKTSILIPWPPKASPVTK